MAFLVCSEFSVKGVVQKVIYCVAAPLNKALYAFEEIIQYEQGSIQKLR